MTRTDHIKFVPMARLAPLTNMNSHITNVLMHTNEFMKFTTTKKCVNTNRGHDIGTEEVNN